MALGVVLNVELVTKTTTLHMAQCLFDYDADIFTDSLPLLKKQYQWHVLGVELADDGKTNCAERNNCNLVTSSDQWRENNGMWRRAKHVAMNLFPAVLVPDITFLWRHLTVSNCTIRTTNLTLIEYLPSKTYTFLYKWLGFKAASFTMSSVAPAAIGISTCWSYCSVLYNSITKTILKGL